MIIVAVKLFSILMNLGEIVFQVVGCSDRQKSQNYPAHIQYIYSSFLY
jgi:hypothetical protein